MGDKSISFVQKALDYAGSNPALVPAFLDLAEAKKDLALSADLHQLYNQLNALATAVEDALLLAGSEAYDGALIFYNAVKGSARSNVPGSSAILQDLQQRFPRVTKKPATQPA